MSGRAATAANETAPIPPLEAIRRKEGEVKRRLVLEAEAARAELEAAERRAQDIIAAAEAEGRDEGEQQRRTAVAQADEGAEAIIAQARAQAELLQRVSAQRMDTAIQQVVTLLSEVRL